MQCRTVDSLADVPAADWNRLNPTGNPFVRHEFLVALERHGAVGEEFGWLPRYFLIETDARLLAATPFYIKTNSYGEFVFDWAWAEAYARSGLDYYPKLVAAAPYSPVTGPRLLLDPADEDARESISRLMADSVRTFATEQRLSGVHWLFTPSAETDALEKQGFMRRLGCQFHWHNAGYRDFDDYLAEFTAARRKKIKRERRRAQEQDVNFEILDGHAITAEQWRQFHRFYVSTFERKGGLPTLSLGFFEELGRTMPEAVVLVLARHGGDYVAAAFNLRDTQTLYGRHWGCSRHFNGLHFEACYYQGLDYCIRHGLSRFEPGAQGEHKVSRGFLPVPTWSAHWLREPVFREPVADFLRREQAGMRHYMDSLMAGAPFRTDSRALAMR
ncbi:MAG TPA: N-acetyltransferase [Gammaproteobacteria bacterium]|nr:N-acetyltransferase [Gammaproteobacteria bacterium]